MSRARQLLRPLVLLAPAARSSSTSRLGRRLGRLRLPLARRFVGPRLAVARLSRPARRLALRDRQRRRARRPRPPNRLASPAWKSERRPRKLRLVPPLCPPPFAANRLAGLSARQPAARAVRLRRPLASRASPCASIRPLASLLPSLPVLRAVVVFWAPIPAPPFFAPSRGHGRSVSLVVRARVLADALAVLLGEQSCCPCRGVSLAGAARVWASFGAAVARSVRCPGKQALSSASICQSLTNI